MARVSENEKRFKEAVDKWFKKYKKLLAMRPKTTAAKIRYSILTDWCLGEGLSDIGATFVDLELEKRKRKK